MITKIYVIYDRVAQEAGPLVCLKNDDLAKRMYAQSLVDQRSTDFDLYLLGEYDTERMKIVSHDAQLLVKGGE